MSTGTKGIRDLYNTFLKEQYDAARHHQTMRVATTTFLTAASGVVFTKVVDLHVQGKPLLILGLLLIVLGGISYILNHFFHRSNRTHVEVAVWTRRVLSINGDSPVATTGGGDLDPNVIARSVRRRMRDKSIPEQERDAAIFEDLAKIFAGLTKKGGGSGTPKNEFNLDTVLKLVPALIVLGGCALVVRELCR